MAAGMGRMPIELSAASSLQADLGKTADRRNAAREPTSDLSEISCAGSKVSLTCMVRNLSRKGALIEASASALPSRFILTNHARRTRAICEVVWRNGRHLGVAFLTPLRGL